MNPSTLHYFAVGLGGAIGAMSRYWVYNLLELLWGDKYPYGTLAVNIIGSFCIGVAYFIFTEKLSLPIEWRLVFIVGFLGAFTTFSTFSLDAFALLEQGYILQSLVYVLVSVVICILAAWSGLVIARLY